MHSTDCENQLNNNTELSKKFLWAIKYCKLWKKHSEYAYKIAFAKSYMTMAAYDRHANYKLLKEVNVACHSFQHSEKWKELSHLPSREVFAIQRVEIFLTTECSLEDT